MMKKITAFLIEACLALAMVLAVPSVHAVESTGTVTNKTFTTTTTEFPNPERGFYLSAAYVSPYFYTRDFTSSSLADVYSKGVRLTIGVLYLGDYKTTLTLPQTFLDAQTAMFALVRASGLKVVLRPAYNYDSGGSDASLSIALNHVAQLAPIFRANADVIAYGQGGFIGAYGENWGSQSLCPDSGGPTASCRTQMFNALLAAYDIRTHIQERYPKHVTPNFPTALGKSQMFSGSNQSRVGYHNDCFMSDNTDVGTYQSSVLTLANAERARVANDTNWQPFGGETCDGFSPTRMACSDILSEGPTYHLTYLNKNYSTNFINSWTSGGCIDQVTRSIGYRFQLDTFSMQSSATAGQSITANIGMENQGWSRIFSARRLNLQLRNTSSGATVICIGDQDLRNLPPGASSATALQVRCTVPVGTASGTYDTYLAIPDVWSTTSGDPRYAVRFANADNSGVSQAWDATNGRFKVGVTFTIP